MSFNIKGKTMKKLNLEEYSDREILEAIFNINSRKFMSLMNGMAAVNASLLRRGETIARGISQVNIDEMFKRIIENEDNNE